jgi:outer membrane protein
VGIRTKFTSSANPQPTMARMPRSVRSAIIVFVACTGSVFSLGQSAPPSPDKVWHPKAENSPAYDQKTLPEAKFDIDLTKTYSLTELIDLAEQHNPQTRFAWQNAKARAGVLGIERSALYPTIVAVALANTARARILFNEDFIRQTYGTFQPELHVEYLIFDFGQRSGAIDAAKADLLAADFAFNDSHRQIIYRVTAAYYNLLNQIGQRGAAEASLKNAQAVQEDAEDRLANGLATKPDVLEATASTAQAQYDLQAVIGGEDIARGELATVLGLPAETQIPVVNIDSIPAPPELMQSVDQDIDRAFQQRPDLKEQIAHLRAAEAGIKEARSSYFPSLGFSGDGGEARQYGEQSGFPPAYAGGEVWNVSLELKWTIFDGTRREHQLAQAKAEKAQAQAAIDALRDEISNEVWAAYSNVKTAQRQRQAAEALVVSANQSYLAARESYQYGVRNLLDVVSAQKTLAQASSEDIFTRTQLLIQLANLAFRTSDLIQTPPARIAPGP